MYNAIIQDIFSFLIVTLLYIFVAVATYELTNCIPCRLSTYLYIYISIQYVTIHYGFREYHGASTGSQSDLVVSWVFISMIK